MRIKETTIEVMQGDITEVETEAIVNAANNKLLMGGGVAGAIRRKGGKSIEEEAIKLGPIPIGEAVATKAGKLKARFVIHAATMGMDFKTDEKKIRDATANSLKCAEENKINSIAFPALGCGVGGFPLVACAKIMSQEVFRHLRETKSNLKEIIFVLYDKEAFDVFKDTIFSYLEHIQYKTQQGPFSTVDVIIEFDNGIVLIERSNPPFGWAIPGGFVDYGESLEESARREAKEETGLDLEELQQFHTYSQAHRDPRFHAISTVYIAKGKGTPKASTDAADLKVFNKNNLPKIIAFDHRKIIKDYFNWKKKNS